MLRIAQPLAADEIEDAAFAIGRALDKGGVAGGVRPGMKVAVTAGSRGIDRIPEALKAVVDWLKKLGAFPFIVPAMGSHGKGTKEGRSEVLESLGIVEKAVGAMIVSESETVVLGQMDGVPVHCSAAAAKADGIVVVNRVKPHTSYCGRYESGLVKMMAVGLGHVPGATAIHARGVRGLCDMVPRMAEVVLDKAPVILGLALIENGLDRLVKVEAIAADKIMEREPGLLEEAIKLKPKLPFAEADVLVVDCLGKDISGTGMDTKVIGRLAIAGEPEPTCPRIQRIVALRLSGSGSAYGIGLADVTTEALVQAMDPEATRTNALASTFLERARVPLAFPSDREAIRAAISTCANPDPETLKLARITDTLHLDEMFVTQPLLDTISDKVDVLEGPLDWEFDPGGNLLGI